jgi:mRNA interferase RelE/StbE
MPITPYPLPMIKLLYGKRFSKDLDAIRHEPKVKKALLERIERIRAADSLGDLKDIRKIEGYRGSFRIKVGDYRLGVKAENNRSAEPRNAGRVTGRPKELKEEKYLKMIEEKGERK